MLKERREAANHVSGRLFEAEDGIDAAIDLAANFVKSMTGGRRTAKLPAPLGHAAIARGINVMAALGTARAEIVAAHSELTVTQTEVGLAAVSFGPGPKPDDPALLTRLRRVHSHAA